MIDIARLVADYDLDKVSIATLASHSSLQIVHGAKKEGFRTVLITKSDRLEFYKSFEHLVDHFIVVNSWKEVCREDVVSKLRNLNSIVIPHGSYVEYVGLDCAENLQAPIFGLRNIFRVEADQKRKMDLLRKAGIPTPHVYSLDEEIDRLVIVKLPGAKGGRGYFIGRDRKMIVERLSNYVKEGVIGSIDEAIVQEYLIGVTAYYHYFYSPILNRLEILGADIRYESDIDGVKRLPPNVVMEMDIEPTFTVVGNIPLVLRESILPRITEFGKRFVEATRMEFGKSIIGPFCLESVIDRDMNIKVFEFSGRIVAGTNLYIYGSPYSYLYWDEPMSTGRRIAREIKMAIEKNALLDVIT